VWIADDVQDARRSPARDFGTMIDQQSPYACLPEARLDEQRIELCISIRPWQDRGEADDRAVAFRHEHVAIPDLLDRQRDRIGMRE
jgi:hypothetical protein